MNQSIACRSTLHSTAALWHPGCGAIRNEFDSFTFQPSSFPTLGHSWGGKRSCKCSRRLIEESSHVPNVVHLILFLQTSLAVVACSRSGSVLAAHTTLHTITQRHLSENSTVYVRAWAHGLGGAVQLLEAAKKQNPGYVQRCMTDPRHL
jgi:hypothetical protein